VRGQIQCQAGRLVQIELLQPIERLSPLRWPGPELLHEWSLRLQLRLLLQQWLPQQHTEAERQGLDVRVAAGRSVVLPVSDHPARGRWAVTLPARNSSDAIIR
jgi:hypothetical protein